MARIKIEMPEHYIFTTVLPIRISEINYGGHLGNDAVLSLVQEARLRFFAEYGYTELDIEGASIIMADAAVVYKSEGFHGDEVEISIAVGDFNKRGCDIYYRLQNRKTGKDIAQVKTGILFFDYETRKVQTVPERFRARMSKTD